METKSLPVKQIVVTRTPNEIIARCATLGCRRPLASRTGSRIQFLDKSCTVSLGVGEDGVKPIMYMKCKACGHINNLADGARYLASEKAKSTL